MTPNEGLPSRKGRSPIKIAIFVLGGLAVLLGSLRGARVLREWWETPSHIELVSDHYRQVSIRGQVEQGNRSSDPTYSILEFDLPPADEPATPPLELLISGSEWGEIRQAANRGFAPDGFKISNNESASMPRAVWQSPDGKISVLIEIVGIDETWTTARIYAFPSVTQQSYSNLVRIGGETTTVPCQRSMLSARFGAPETETKRIEVAL